MRVIDQIKLIVDSTKEYPVYLSDIKKRHPTHTFPIVVYETDVEPLGYFIVHRTSPPTDGYPVEIAPVFNNGRYEQAWTTRELTVQEASSFLNRRKHELKKKLEHQMFHELALGCPYTFPNGQTRHILMALEDRVNVLGLHVDAGRHITPQDPDPSLPEMELRVQEKDIMILTPLQMQTLSYFALDVFKAFYRIGWRLEYIIDQATTLAELPIIPVSVMDDAVNDVMGT